jgi:hypothetical protein
LRREESVLFLIVIAFLLSKFEDEVGWLLKNWLVIIFWIQVLPYSS